MRKKQRGSVRCLARVFSAVMAGLLSVVAAWGTEPGGSQDAGAAELRRWRDRSGQYEIEASLERVLADGVQLRRKDGKLVTVPLTRLSEEDRTYVQGLRQPNPLEVTSETQAASKLGTALVVVTVTLGGTAFTDGTLRGVPLNLVAQVPGTYDRRRAPMCFAPTGDWLYLVDGNNTLRKIRTRDLTEAATLPLTAECEDLAFSQAGLIVPLTSARRIWVVDAESLQVRREVPLDGVRLVAASPASPLGFALALAAHPDMVTVVASSRLAMIDFATGRRLHELCNQYRGQSGIQFLAVDNQPVLDAPVRNIELTQDGRYLFMASRSITRFRVDGQDLIFEERGPSLENGPTTHFVLSRDGTRTALPTGGGNGGGNFSIGIYDAKKLDRQLLSLSNGANPCALGFDPQSGKMYSPNNQNMQVFGPQGEKLSEAPLQDRDVRRIIVHPQGGRFVAWSSTKVTWYELCRPQEDR